jgi:hypothetical protein
MRRQHGEGQRFPHEGEQRRLAAGSPNSNEEANSCHRSSPEAPETDATTIAMKGSAGNSKLNEPTQLPNTDFLFGE